MPFQVTYYAKAVVTALTLALRRRQANGPISPDGLDGFFLASAVSACVNKQQLTIPRFAIVYG